MKDLILLKIIFIGAISLAFPQKNAQLTIINKFPSEIEVYVYKTDTDKVTPVEEMLVNKDKKAFRLGIKQDTTLQIKDRRQKYYWVEAVYKNGSKWMYKPLKTKRTVKDTVLVGKRLLRNTCIASNQVVKTV